MSALWTPMLHQTSSLRPVLGPRATGLPKVPSAQRIDIGPDGKVVGLF